MKSAGNILWDEFKDMCQRYLDYTPIRLVQTRCKQPWISHTSNNYPVQNSLCTTMQHHHNLHFTVVKKEIQKIVIRLTQTRVNFSEL